MAQYRHFGNSPDVADRPIRACNGLVGRWGGVGTVIAHSESVRLRIPLHFRGGGAQSQRLINFARIVPSCANLLRCYGVDELPYGSLRRYSARPSSRRGPLGVWYFIWVPVHVGRCRPGCQSSNDCAMVNF